MARQLGDGRHTRRVRSRSPRDGSSGAGPNAPAVVLEGPPGCARPDVERLRIAGFAIVVGLRTPAHAARVVRTGVVDDARSASDALLAVLAGVGVVIEARADRATIDRLVDDMRRVGPVDHRVVGSAVPAMDGEPPVSVEGRAILGLMAMGLSLGEAARMLGLSRRTADRRLAEARRDLGVSRTTEAIAAAQRLGWLDRPGLDA